MESKRGCLKPALFGCLGLIVIIFLITGITALVAWRGVSKEQVEDQELAPQTFVWSEESGQAAGRVILELSEGEFQILPGKPGEGLKVEARYDTTAYELSDLFESLPDRTWVYRVRFKRSISGLQALFRAIMGGDTSTYVHIYLPPDIPIALDILARKGGFEGDIGGLWLTEANIACEMGGFELSVDEPLREPMESLTLRSQMGGFEVSRLGNASPRKLDIQCKMGGADVDLSGAWVQDCDARLAISMGGMGLGLPDDIEVIDLSGKDRGLRHQDAEVSLPVLRLDIHEKWGEIDTYSR